MSALSSNVAPTSNEYAGDEVSAIVLDPGYTTTRAGFAGEDVPKSIVPSFYGTLPSSSSDRLFGENAIYSARPGLEIKNYWGDDGIVQDWDAATKLWEYTITSRLTGQRATDPRKNGLNDGTNAEKGKDKDPDAMDVDQAVESTELAEKPLAENPLLMTEPGWNSAKAREKAIEVAIEDWGTPAFYLQKTGVLAAFASGKGSGLVIDVGAQHTSVTPVLDGMVLRKGVQKSPLAGNFISNQIRTLFKQATPEIKITPHFMVQSKTAVDAGAPAQATYRTFDPPPTPSYRALEEDRVLTAFKESVVEVWNAPAPAHKLSAGQNEEYAKSSMLGRPFELPDGYNQVFTLDRFRAAEALFDPSAAVVDDETARPKDEHGIIRLVQAAIQAVDADHRAHLLQNIVVTGASSLLYKFTERLQQEMNLLYPSTRNKIVAPGSVPERKYAAWIGGSILASLGSFHQLWISKKEYDEHGPGIVEKRCR